MILFVVLIPASKIYAQSEDNQPFDDINIIEVTIPAGTALTVEIENKITSTKTKPGDAVSFKLLANFIKDNQVALYKNTQFFGSIDDISKASLLDDTYNLLVNINKMSIPFKGDYSIKAHPVFDLKKHRKKKGRLFTFGYAHKKNDLLDDIGEDKPSKPKNTEDSTLEIPSGTKLDIILDEDVTLDIKVKKDITF